MQQDQQHSILEERLQEVPAKPGDSSTYLYHESDG